MHVAGRPAAGVATLVLDVTDRAYFGKLARGMVHPASPTDQLYGHEAYAYLCRAAMCNASS